MADVSVTATAVAYDETKNNDRKIAGETITAGQALYLNSTDGKVYKADADDASITKAVVVGIAMNGAAAGQPVSYQMGGDVNFGSAIFTVGLIYTLSTTPGGICPSVDITTSPTGKSMVVLGVARSTSVLAMPSAGAYCPAIRP